MSMQTSTLDKLLRLESLYRQGYQSDDVDRSLDKLIQVESVKRHRGWQSTLDENAFLTMYSLNNLVISVKLTAEDVESVVQALHRVVTKI